jgi:UDP-glucuronate 4-epimerase
MEQIMVTGGAGFIGSHVCAKLLEEGYSVLCIDNLNEYYSPSIKKKNIEKLEKQAQSTKGTFIFYQVDFTDKQVIEKIFTKDKPTKVIHLGARAGVRPSLKDPQLYADVNIKGTLNLLESARKHNIQRFVFGSSSSVYGINKKIPFNEEDTVDQQTSPYAVSKRAGELYCYCYHHLYKLSIVCLRFFTVYGPAGRPDMAPFIFTSRISEGVPIDKFGDGSSKRDYTHISDITQGVVSALTTPNLSYEIINLGNSSPITLNQFIDIIENAVRQKAIINQKPMQPGDVPLTYADSAKAEQLLGYNPQFPIQEGMGTFAEWLKENKEHYA